MMRLLLFAPFIAAAGCIFLVFWFVVRPIINQDQKSASSFKEMITNVRSEWEAIKENQEMMANQIALQRQDLELQLNASKGLKANIETEAYTDVDLASLNQAITNFNLKAAELAQNEGAIIDLNESLKNGMSSLQKQVDGLQLADLLKPKANVSARINTLNEQIMLISGLQQSLADKSKEYANDSQDAIEEYQRQLRTVTEQMSQESSAKQIELREKIKNIMDSQKDMLSKLREQEDRLADIRAQNAVRMQDTKERMRDLMDKIKDKMADAREKMQANKDKMRDLKDKMDDAKARAQDARDRARDLQERLKDRSR